MTAVDVEVPTLTFAAGLPGFPEARNFALVWWGDENGPFSILMSLDENGLEFLVAPPHTFFPDYSPEIDDDTAERLEIEDPEEAVVLAIITVGDDPTSSTANLLAPIVVNHRTRAAAQVVLDDGAQPLRAPLFPR